MPLVDLSWLWLTRWLDNMTGFAKNLPTCDRAWSSSPLIVSQDSFSQLNWASLQLGGAYVIVDSNGYNLIFLKYYFITINFCVSLPFGGFLVLGPYNHLHNCKCLFVSLHGFSGQWEDWAPINRINHTCWIAVVTPTDRPKSVRNRLIDVTCLWCLFFKFLLVMGLLS